MSKNITILDISEKRSKLIQRVEYDEDNMVLSVILRYSKYPIFYSEVYLKQFEEFAKTPSIGKYYLHFIKPNFKQLKKSKMADRPKTRNMASDKKRFIKLSIDVTKIKKEWIHSGDKGAYLNMTLQLLPDGNLDTYGNLGMITQDVPKVVYEKEKGIPKSEKTSGPILGNGAEFEPFSSFERTPGEETGKLGVADEDLPF